MRDIGEKQACVTAELDFRSYDLLRDLKLLEFKSQLERAPIAGRMTEDRCNVCQTLTPNRIYKLDAMQSR